MVVGATVVVVVGATVVVVVVVVVVGATVVVVGTCATPMSPSLPAVTPCAASHVNPRNPAV